MRLLHRAFDAYGRYRDRKQEDGKSEDEDEDEKPPQTKAEMIKMQLDQVRTFKAKDIIINNDPEGYMALIETILSDQNQAILPVIINID